MEILAWRGSPERIPVQIASVILFASRLTPAHDSTQQRIRSCIAGVIEMLPGHIRAVNLRSDTIRTMSDLLG
jgi:hypothetical protein